MENSNNCDSSEHRSSVRGSPCRRSECEQPCIGPHYHLDMIFCLERLMKNYDSVLEFYQVLMRDTYKKCDANVGNFIEYAKAVELYIKDA